MTNELPLDQYTTIVKPGRIVEQSKSIVNKKKSNKFQGPTRPTDNTKLFRKTGMTVPLKDKLKKKINKPKNILNSSQIKKVAMGGRNLVTALTSINTGKGRRKGSFKRGIPVQQYNQMQSRRLQVMLSHRQREAMRLQEKGYTQEDVRRMSEKEIIARMPISANTLTMLDRIRRIQNSGKIANLEMQRRVRERRIVNNEMSLLKTPSLFGPESNTFNIFDESGNPLATPNIFKELPNNKIMKTNRPNILQTRETGHDLHF